MNLQTYISHTVDAHKQELPYKEELYYNKTDVSVHK